MHAINAIHDANRAHEIIQIINGMPSKSETISDIVLNAKWKTIDGIIESNFE